MTGPTPLFDCFKRGEVAREVRLLAAQGALAPRAHEQLAILMLLLEDGDPEIRRTADQTVARIPIAALTAFLARSDTASGVRDFFAARGIVADDTVAPAEPSDEPLIDTAAAEVEVIEPHDAAPLSVLQRLGRMTFPERLKAAIKGSREMRAVLIRDTNKMIAAAVLSSPRLTDSEVEGFARMTSVGEEVLRVIAGNRAWLKSYGVVVGLAKNSKTPLAMSLNLLSRLNKRDVVALSVDRNIPEPLRMAARKKVAASSHE